MSAKDDNPQREVAAATQSIDGRIAELDDWRGETLARMRALIRRPIRRLSRNGNGAACRSGRTQASSAPARPTRTS